MSIDFKLSKGIFQQIADNLCHQILEGKLSEGDRVPSVRDLAAEYEVNRNTLLRTYSILENAGIITNKRGIGFFVSVDAVNIIRKNEKKEFFSNDLPEFLNKIRLLELSKDDLAELLGLINSKLNQ